MEFLGGEVVAAEEFEGVDDGAEEDVAELGEEGEDEDCEEDAGVSEGGFEWHWV